MLKKLLKIVKKILKIKNFFLKFWKLENFF